MNSYFWRFCLPLYVITSFVILGAVTNYIQINWWVVAVTWVLIGLIGNGLGCHRLFSHRQFETWRPVELAIAFLGTYAAYAPILFWAGTHQLHHKVTDTKDDLSSPHHHGFIDSFFLYRLRERALKAVDLRNYCVKRIMKDKALMWFSLQFNKIVWSIIAFWVIFDIVAGYQYSMLASAFAIPVIIEHMRMNVINSFTHMNVPGSYRVFDTPDNTTNHPIIGLLTFGAGWHNAHHHDARELVNTHRWWELDIEGLIGKLLTKKSVVN